MYPLGQIEAFFCGDIVDNERKERTKKEEDLVVSVFSSCLVEAAPH